MATAGPAATAIRLGQAGRQFKTRALRRYNEVDVDRYDLV